MFYTLLILLLLSAYIRLKIFNDIRVMYEQKSYRRKKSWDTYHLEQLGG